jgi:hypothetical protein
MQSMKAITARVDGDLQERQCAFAPSDEEEHGARLKPRPVRIRGKMPYTMG